MILWCLFRRLGIESININTKTNKTTYGGKSHGCASRPCPPLWHAQFTSHATHWSTLIRNPINCPVSTRLPFAISSCHRTGSESVVIHIFNPWYCRVMDIGFVTGIHMIYSYLHFNGFVRIKHKRLETNYFTMRITQRWNMGHVKATTLKRKS